MEWFVGQDGKALGPFSSEEVAQMVQAGKITADTPIRHHQDPRWFTASQIPGLLPSQAAPAQPDPAPTPAVQAKPAQSAPAPTTSSSSKASVSKPQPELRVAKPLPPSDPPAPIAPPISAPPIIAQPVIAQAAPSPFQIRTEAAPAGPTASTPSAPATPNFEEIKRKKKQQSQRTLMILGGGCFAVLVGAILIFALRPKPTEAVATAPEETNPAPAVTSSSAQEKDPVAPVETNPQPATEPAAPAAATNVSAKKASPAVNPALADLKLIRGWVDTTRNALKLNSVSVRITKAWIASDTLGTPLPPPKPVSKFEKLSEEEPSTTKEETPSTDTFIVVEIQMTNTKPEAVKVAAWSKAGKSPGILTTKDLTPLDPVAVDQLPAGSKDQEIALSPNTPHIQTLVFRGTKLDGEPLRLALPHAAIQAKSQGYFAFEIPAKVYMASPDGATATSKKLSKPLTGLAAEQAKLNAQIEAVAEEQATPSPDKKTGKMPAEEMPAEMEAEMPASEEMEEEDSPDRIFPRKPADKKIEASDAKNAKEKAKKPELTKEQKLDAAFEKAAKSIAPDPDAPPPASANTKTKSPRKTK